jgi:uncharacterized Zn-binding protein involved in type VI secretion
VVVSASGTVTINGKRVARKGDHVTCPIPGHGAVTIIEGDPLLTDDGKPIALEGHKCSCGCSLISTLSTFVRSPEGSGAGIAGAGALAAVASALGAEGNPRPDQQYDEQVRILDEEGNALDSLPFTVKLANGDLIQGHTDENGLTDRYFTDEQEIIEVYIGHLEEGGAA